jgi:molybdopterin-guanine dinucleotide biosynthesis protein MobB
MRLLAVVGYSDSGKTRLIQSLIPEIKARGLSVAVIKHCHEGFDWDHSNKDSGRFMEAGADGIGLWSLDYRASLRKVPVDNEVPEWAARVFGSMDVVLMEGGKNLPDVPKIEVRANRDTEPLDIPADELRAVVTDHAAASKTSHFFPHQVKELVDLLLEEGEDRSWSWSSTKKP